NRLLRVRRPRPAPAGQRRADTPLRQIGLRTRNRRRWRDRDQRLTTVWTDRRAARWLLRPIRFRAREAFPGIARHWRSSVIDHLVTNDLQRDLKYRPRARENSR